MRKCTVLAVGVLLALPLAWTGCKAPGSDDSQAEQLTIVDYNIFHGLYDEDPAALTFDRFNDRLLLLAEELGKLKPDVIVLQEVVLNPPPKYLDVRETLRTALGGEYKTVWADTSGADPIGDGENPPGTAVIGRLIITRLPLVGSKENANAAVFSGRSMHRVTVKMKRGVVDIYNVHLEGPEFLEQQAQEIENALKFIDPKFIDRPRNLNPVIVTGDFNSRPRDLAIARMLDAEFFDVEAVAKWDVTCDKPGDPGCTRNQFPDIVNNQVNKANIRIDYMFARKGTDYDLRVISAVPFNDHPFPSDPTDDRQFLWLSDHIGIKATLEVVPRIEVGPRK